MRNGKCSQTAAVLFHERQKFYKKLVDMNP